MIDLYTAATPNDRGLQVPERANDASVTHGAQAMLIR